MRYEMQKIEKEKFYGVYDEQDRLVKICLNMDELARYMRYRSKKIAEQNFSRWLRENESEVFTSEPDEDGFYTCSRMIFYQKRAHPTIKDRQSEVHHKMSNYKIFKFWEEKISD